MNQIVTKIDTGVLFAFKQITSPVAYCALSIKAGTRDEDPKFKGIAHFTEHMLFKGTKNRRAITINGYLEKLGGELNAYTTKEELVIHATVLKEDLQKAVELLADLAFNATFPEKEIEKERGVILEEISSYKDSPSELIFDDFDEMVFGEHPLASPILGYPKTIKKIDSNALGAFRNKHFVTQNMSFSIVADTSFDKAKTLAEKYFKAYAPKTDNVYPLQNSDILNSFNTPFEKVLYKKTFQAHCVIGVPTYSYYNQKRYTAALLTNVLGGPALNSRLNTLLREKHALAYTVEASNNSYTDTGLFSVYFGTDKINISRCLNLIQKEFTGIIKEGLSPVRLKAAKKQLLGQLAIASDNPEAQCLNMGKSLLVYGKVDSIEEVRAKIEEISEVDIHTVANEMLNPDKFFTIIYK